MEKKKADLKAYAVILAGGNGERFWPLSTPARPKQFLSLFGKKTLIQHAVDRLKGLIPPERILIITSKRLVTLTRHILPMVPKKNIVGEPCRRDTAAAVATACGLVKRLGGENAVGCILTADQLIKPIAKFRQILKNSIVAARQEDAIVTMGILPTYPATGFGYIKCSTRCPIRCSTTFNHVECFVEKPSLDTANEYLKAGTFLWNAGMFIWKQATLEEAFKNVASDYCNLIEEIACQRNTATVLSRQYKGIRATSFDYAVMEKIKNIIVARCDFIWDDVGSWFAIQNHFDADASNNISIGCVTLLDTTNTITVTDNQHLVALVGVNNLVVVHTEGATLVCSKDAVQDVKKIVQKINKR